MSSRQLLLGLDVGTTATKALACDLHGNVVASASRTYGLLTPHPGWVEQDPEALWSAVVASVREIADRLAPGDRILALAQASQGGTTIPVDADGMPLYPAISWMDGRGIETAQAMAASPGADYVRTTTGWPLSPTLSLQHIAWLREHQPDIFQRVDRFLFVNDFITDRLTGRTAMNPSDATMTQLFNIGTGDWDDRLLMVAGIERRRLSPIRPSGTVLGRLTEAAGSALGLSADVIVVNGAHDQYCAAVGTGVLNPGAVLLSCGTAWVILAVPETLEAGLASGLAISSHAVPGRWGAIRSLGGVGASLEWFINQVWQADLADPGHRYATLNEGVRRAAPGAHGLLFYPQAGGHADTSARRGAFVHLTLEHTRADMARAVMEGTAMELRWALDEIRATAIAVDRLTMVGGAAESPVWPQIVADVTGVPVTLPVVRQAAAQGAALLAGIGAGCFPDAEAAYEAFRGAVTAIDPDRQHVQRYEDLFTQYRRRYPIVVDGAF